MKEKMIVLKEVNVKKQIINHLIKQRKLKGISQLILISKSRNLTFKIKSQLLLQTVKRIWSRSS